MEQTQAPKINREHERFKTRNNTGATMQKKQIKRINSDHVIVIRKRPLAKPPAVEVKAAPHQKKIAPPPVPKPEKKVASVATKKKKKKKKNKIPMEFLRPVLSEIEKIAPKKIPYKVGINKDIFEIMKATYFGDRKKLRRAISVFFYFRTQKKRYIESIIDGKYRYGLSSKRYPIADNEKKSAIEKLSELERKAEKIRKKQKKKNDRKFSRQRISENAGPLVRNPVNVGSTRKRKGIG